MSSPQKKRMEGGRVTPRGTSDVPRKPSTKSQESPKWVPILMFSLLAAGVLIIFFNYVGWLPGGTSNSCNYICVINTQVYTHPVDNS